MNKEIILQLQLEVEQKNNLIKQLLEEQQAEELKKSEHKLKYCLFENTIRCAFETYTLGSRVNMNQESFIDRCVKITGIENKNNAEEAFMEMVEEMLTEYVGKKQSNQTTPKKSQNKKTKKTKT